MVIVGQKHFCEVSRPFTVFGRNDDLVIRKVLVDFKR